MPQLFTNAARSLLQASILSTDTSLTVEAAKADLFPVANTGTGSVPATTTDWFKATLQDSSGNIEIVYVRTRAAASAVLSNVMRAQEGTTARTYAVGSVVGLRVTAADVQGAIAIRTDLAAAGGAGLVGNTPAGNIAASTVQAALNELDAEKLAVGGNAGTVNNGVYTVGDQTVNGVKTFTSLPTLPSNATAAMQAVPKQQVDAAVAPLLAKTGGTMTGSITLASGAVIYSSQSGAADNARNTGYKMNDGQDIGEMNRSNQYIDDRASNCNGYVGNGNCQSNPNWTPPNGNWWEWYSVVGGTAWANNGSYDGVGGTTYAYNPVSVGVNYDAYYLGADEIGGGEYHRNYRNCNCGAFNCRTNCNCNCNCACCGSC